MLEKIVYTIRDQSAIFQLAILSSLAGAREYGWLKKKRELSEKFLSDFIKFL
jgi:hypothetical protein